MTPDHHLKFWPVQFNAILSGLKTHELRRCDDRQFKAGEIIRLEEFEPSSEAYTGRTLDVKITYITSAAAPCALSRAALHRDFCILNIAVQSC